MSPARVATITQEPAVNTVTAPVDAFTEHVEDVVEYETVPVPDPPVKPAVTARPSA